MLKAKKGGKTTDKIFKYSEHNGEIIITGLQEGVATTSIVIPEAIDGMPVTEIYDYAFCGSPITDIKIGRNIKVLGKQAFSECKNLKSAIWNCKCNAIPDYCFYRCTKLKHFDFSTIKKVGQYAFRESGLQEVRLPKNIEILECGTFSRCNGLRSVAWNCKCDAISAHCFSECPNLTQFDFSGIKKIERYAFWRSGLQEVFLPKNIEIISTGTFSRCNGLRSVTWNCKYNAIPSYCFYMCPNLTNFDFAGIKKIEQDAFGKSGLISVTLSKETAVVQSCFAYCNDLKKIEWLSARNIKGDIFKECKNIKEIYISDKVKNIEANAFESSPNAEITFV
ncbi:leucine-rich repeat domain-containing protein [Ruminococcus sp.]|uniref:leucine-rich repeat domain-containing protein n=1 Tax=Ruminococcus sp. TaxID=41978 RepID=UPI002E781EE2|nr:leucine-rich repeat protein [Ruminococcus sp.]MEE0470775.1 leucine-rich repeat protein [Ruminococcus sp.]